MSEPWHRISGGRYRGARPLFYDPQEFEWSEQFTANWQDIRNEAEEFLAQNESGLRSYFLHSMAFPPDHWKTMGFLFWGWRISKNCRRCPKLTALLKSIPGLTSASLSVIEPGGVIQPHQGDTDAVIRGHLGLRIPDPAPEVCGIQVGAEIRGWREGALLLFCDAHAHSAWNQSDTRRLVLIFDVILPEFRSRQNDICARVLAAIALLVAYERWRFLRSAPGNLRSMIYAALRLPLKVALPLRRLFTG